MRIRSSLLVLFSFAILGASLQLRADDDSAATAVTTDGASQPKAESSAEPAEPALRNPDSGEAKSAPKKSSRRLEKADAFIAPPDWEFDGFVAGGQDQEVRSLYYLNDLVYVNIGNEQGFQVGDRVSIYKRGAKVRNPQTKRFMGYEVRRAATSQVTDRISGNYCSLRILQANEAVEVGDLVRRAD
jgi:hypothetical protein